MSTQRGGEAGTSNVTTELVFALGGEQNFKTLMDLIAQTTSQVALTRGNVLLDKSRKMQHQQQNLTTASPGVDASRAGTPISGRSTDVHAVTPLPPPPPKRRMKLDWNSELLSLPSDQNNDVNAKTRLVAERHFKISDHWKDQPTEKKQECITEVRSFYKGADQIPDSFFRDKFNAWGRNRRQYLNKNIRSFSAGKKSVDDLRKICSEELQQELTKISQSNSMEKIREAQKKKEESGHVFVHHLGAGGRRLFKEDFLSGPGFCEFTMVVIVYDRFSMVF
ncbi:hypothetical protein R1sor_019966 [Riccia sorocarpa]|uniref:Uncharacterized protein n=1 Tax=Riccia sorocarpa TaxID=122646 RepID=A0ABD3IK94_9MARC